MAVLLDFRTMFLRFPDFSAKSVWPRRILAALTLESGTPFRSGSSSLLIDKRNQPMHC
jgi:hypothetical protein